MKRTFKTATILLLASPLLTHCVPSQDYNSLDLRIRNLDNQVFQLGKAVNRMGGGTEQDNPMERIQTKQAELSDSIDRLNSEVMQLKGKMEENSFQAKGGSGMQEKVDQLSQHVAALTDQVNQNTAALRGGAQPSGTPMVAAVNPADKEPAVEEPAPVKIKPEEREAAAPVEKKKPAAEKEKAKPAEEAESAAPADAGDPGKATYDKGIELFRASKFNEAYRTFSDYLSKYPKGKMAPNARFWLGDCYYNQQEFELAILEYQKVIADYPGDSKAPSALLKQGLAFEKLKDNETAKIIYNKLIKDYPKSDQVETAKKRLDSIK